VYRSHQQTRTGNVGVRPNEEGPGKGAERKGKPIDIAGYFKEETISGILSMMDKQPGQQGVSKNGGVNCISAGLSEQYRWKKVIKGEAPRGGVFTVLTPKKKHQKTTYTPPVKGTG